MNEKGFFPDGTPIDGWFYDYYVPQLDELGTQYVISDYGVHSDGRVYTEEIQAIIDKAANNGGGVVVVPKGEYITGALFFKQNVNLYIHKGAVLKGSDDISHYPVCDTRIEGESCKYYPALINADGVDGFVICGKGTIDGNGERSWKAFWQRRKWNPQCTNKDEQRPRLIYVSNSTNVTIANLNLKNSPFWTNHVYKCDHVKFIGCNIFSPKEPIKAPSTDAIDIDVCHDVLIKHCVFHVNDDGVALKGGKGPWADTAPENGSNERIIIEDSQYNFCHGCLTCGSESIHNKNIIVRRNKVNGAAILLWLKLRPDTPQNYEYISVENIEGYVHEFLRIVPWIQFYDLKDRKEIPLSYASNIKFSHCDCDCERFFNAEKNEEQYILSDFTFENLDVRTKMDGYKENIIHNAKINNVKVVVGQ